MIAFLRGTVAGKSLSEAVLDVGGVGYAVGISASTSAALPAPGTDTEVLVYTQLAVREDNVSLYGFATREERMVFGFLTAISGVGPKLALSVLSAYSPSELQAVVNSEDERRMCAVPGVGKKTAQRMLIELKDSFKKAGLTAAGQENLPGMAASSAAVEEAASVLLSMGFTSREAELALGGYDGPADRTEEAITYALKRLGSAS